MAVEKTAESKRALRLDFPGYAQEFLRRSPHYRRSYDSVMSDRHADPASQEVMARRWGLCFPGRSASFCGCSTRLLGCCGLPLCRDLRRCAARDCG
ncbi:transcriptional regulator domain-containing protein [Sphingopyxis sp.]|uniref:transcriptional regulator domain-containing protein n=1 Tax=Sphingopyxis sp. TaxID=1908224 RepID=UPI002D7671BB|nr:DUF6499 domain-containing protein [Sphingopyxis sp.]HET6523158.1 DUF6499 domain-containing protein [Sphingopyxis sp.]